MEMCPFPDQIYDSKHGFTLDAYSAANRMDLWLSIISDRENPKRKKIWPGMNSFEDLKKYMSACDNENPASAEFGYILRDPENYVAGTLHIFAIHWPNDTAEVGYALHHAFEGKGLATNALLCLETCLKAMGFRILKVNCQQWNEKSSAVAERAGFQLVKRAHKDKDCEGCDDCTRYYEKKI